MMRAGGVLLERLDPTRLASNGLEVHFQGSLGVIRLLEVNIRITEGPLGELILDDFDRLYGANMRKEVEEIVLSRGLV